MTLDFTSALVLILAAGFGLQWLAWRLRVPAILPLLLAGIVLGPVTGWLDPDAVMGHFLFPVASLAVALILFEGSMTLRFSELRGIGRAVHGMVTYGAVLTLVLLALAVHWIAGVGWGVAFLFGALTCVTGPTVIGPLLRTLRPTAPIANALRWEGIILDPLGALFALLVFQALVSHEQGHSLALFGATVGVGVLVGALMAAVLAALLHQQWMPEYLHNYGSLCAVLGAFALANALAEESGLIAVTIMGIVLGNLRRIHVDHIMAFTGDLSVLFVSMLFVVLAARLPWPLPDGVFWAGIAVFIVAQVVIRPVSILVSSFRSQLSWRERALLAFVAPRGVVAAAVSSLFALRLGASGDADANMLVPLVFILIIATVGLQSLAARPLAKLLHVAAPEADGVLIFGSDEVARAVALALLEQDVNVLLVDDDWAAISQARMAGIPTFYGGPISRHTELHLDLTPIGMFFAMSMRRELNHLACVHYREQLGREEVYRLRLVAPENATDRRAIAGRLRSKVLFGRDITHTRFRELLRQGWHIKSNALTEHYGWPDFVGQHGAETVLLFGVEAGGALRVANDWRKVEPRVGWTAIALIPPAPAAGS